MHRSRRASPSLIMLSTCLFGQTGPYSIDGRLRNDGRGARRIDVANGRTRPRTVWTVRSVHRLRRAAFLGRRAARRAASPRPHRRRPAHRSVAGRKRHALPIGRGRRRVTVRASYPDRLGNTDPHMSPHDAFRCAGDDQWIAIAIRDDADWRKLVAAIGSPELAALRDAGARRAACGGGRRSREQISRMDRASERARRRKHNCNASVFRRTRCRTRRSCKTTRNWPLREHFVRTDARSTRRRLRRERRLPFLRHAAARRHDPEPRRRHRLGAARDPRQALS